MGGALLANRIKNAFSLKFFKLITQTFLFRQELLADHRKDTE